MDQKILILKKIDSLAKVTRISITECDSETLGRYQFIKIHNLDSFDDK